MFDINNHIKSHAFHNDHICPINQIKPIGPYVKSMVYNGFIDTYRFCNGNEREYTYYQNREGELRSASRIDSIWVHPFYGDQIEESGIIDTSLEARSDHFCAYLELDVHKYIGHDVYKKHKRLNYRLPKLWNLKQASTEEWTKFEEEVEGKLGELNIYED